MPLTHFLSVLPNCKGTYTSPVGMINSPSISATYKHNINCLWNIKVPQHLQLVLAIDLPWGDNVDCHNFLLIHDDITSRKYQINSRKVCIQSDARDDIIMEKNVAVIDYYGQVRDLSQNSYDF